VSKSPEALKAGAHILSGGSEGKETSEAREKGKNRREDLGTLDRVNDLGKSDGDPPTREHLSRNDDPLAPHRLQPALKKKYRVSVRRSPDMIPDLRRETMAGDVLGGPG